MPLVCPQTRANEEIRFWPLIFLSPDQGYLGPGVLSDSEVPFLGLWKLVCDIGCYDKASRLHMCPAYSGCGKVPVLAGKF